MSLLERVRAIRDAYYNEYRDRRNLFDKHGRRLDQPSDIGAGASFPRPRVRCGVWRRGVAGMMGNDDEDADESCNSEQEDSSGEESDESEAESEDDDDEEGSAEGDRQKGRTTLNRPGFSPRPRHYPPFHLPPNPASHPSMSGHQQGSYERWIPPPETVHQTNRAPVTAKTSKAVDRRYDIWLPPNMAPRQHEKGKPPTS